MMLASILENFTEEEITLADGFDEAVIGIEISSMRLVYSVRMVIDIMMDRDGMDEQEAIDWYEYNMQSTWVGDTTPIWSEDRFI
mgnify:FL=1|tara:strand:+ start:2631 stop:2882 length:252 start_codon:yes stop_codon:yes gene_type:complete